ncbi:hypothetical protein H0H93_012421, partial [Arthromyces matolae]
MGRTDPAYRTQAPIVANPERTKNIFERCLDSKITVSVEEICSIAPDIRGKFRDAVTPKRVTAAEPVVTAMATVEDVNEIEDALVPAVQSFAIYPTENTPHIDTAYIEDMDDLPDLLYPEETPTASTSTEIPTTFGLRNGALVVPDPYDIYLRTLPPGRAPEILNVAREAESLRAIMMVIDGRTAVESIVDSGSQIIAMSEEVCNHLHLQYDPTVRLNMQSANGTIDSSLGIARNVPCAIGEITLYLQIHILRNPSYDILLGRPFDVVTRSSVQTLSDDD